MLFQLRAERQAELVQLAANFAASSRGRGMASLDKGLRPEPLGQIPDIRVRLCTEGPLTLGIIASVST